METFGKLIWNIMITAFMIILHGWVFTTVFNWIAVPLFDMTAITLLHGVAIRFLWGTLDTNYFNKRKFKQTLEEDSTLDDAQTITYWVMKIFIVPLILILTGWIITLFI